MNETLLKALVVAGLVLGVFASGAWVMHGHDQKKYDVLVAESSMFKGEVETASADFERQRKAREAQDQRDKEKADDNQKTQLAAARADAKRMRDERDAARGSFLTKSPAGSKCPDGQVCFDSALFDGAYRGLVADLRATADQCTAVETALSTAREWAQHGTEEASRP